MSKLHDAIRHYHDAVRVAGHATGWRKLDSSPQVCSGRAGSASKAPVTQPAVIVIKRNGRFMAVHRKPSVTELVAAATRKRGNWDKLPQTATRARVVRNYR